MWREFVEQAERREETFARLCARFGISRKTGYKWLRRYQAAGPAGLVAQSRRPKSSPGQTPAAIVARVIALRRRQPEWSAVRLHEELGQLGVVPRPAPSTIDRILRRHREAVEARGPRAGAGEPQPNERWLIRRGAPVRDGEGRVHTPWLIWDEASRFVLAARLLAPGVEPDLDACLDGCFRAQGLPWRISLPADPAARGLAPCRLYSAQTVGLMRRGIAVEFETAPAGAAAASDRLELAARLAALPAYQRGPLAERLAAADPLPALQQAAPPASTAVAPAWLEQWRERFNFGGRQEALQRRGPVARYRPSERLLPTEPVEPRYPADAPLRLISEKGSFAFRRRLVLVGRAFSGCTVQVRPWAPPLGFAVEFAGHWLGWFDLAADYPEGSASLPLLPES